MVPVFLGILPVQMSSLMTRAVKPLNLLLSQPETGPGIPWCRDFSYCCSDSSVGSLRGVRLAPIAKYGKVGGQNKMDPFEDYKYLPSCALMFPGCHLWQ